MKKVTLTTSIFNARKMFQAQLTKSNAIKLECLKRATMSYTEDAQKLFNDYMKRVEELTDSKRYCADAKAQGLDATILASHIVFLGPKMVRTVLRDGLMNSPVAEDLELYTEAFLPDNAQDFAKA